MWEPSRPHTSGDAETPYGPTERLDGGEVGAAYVWQTPEGWAGRRYHLGTNKKASNTEIYAIYQALRAFDQRQESGHRHTIFADSTTAIDRVRTDAIGPYQRFAVASREVCTRVLARENEVAVRWVPAHGISGNEKADEYARAAAEGRILGGEAPDKYRWDTSLSQ